MRTTEWLRGVCERLFQAQSRQRASSRAARQPAQAELLETRQLLAANITLNAGGWVKIDGTSQDDVATVEAVDADNIRIRVVTGAETVEQVIAKTALTAHIEFDALGGHDSLTNTTDRRVTMLGDVGNDTFVGGTGADTFLGGNGDDSFEGGAGNDQAFGGEGHDSLVGGGGHDSLKGEAGNDTINADTGNDTVSGGEGTDSLNGGTGTDQILETLTGDTANYTVTNYVLAQNSATSTDAVKNFESASLTGSASHDRIDASGFTFPVTVWGGGANDTIIGGSLADLLYGEAGDDSLIGNGGNDTLVGGVGNDAHTGGAGDDVLNGGAGTDVVSETADANLTLNDTSLAGAGNDRLLVIEYASLTGGAGANTLNASAFTKGPVTLNGGAGNDSLIGSALNDILIGGLGADSLDGGAGIDVLEETGDDLQLQNDRVVERVNNVNFTNPHVGIEKYKLLGTSANSLLRAGLMTNGTATLLGGEGDDTLEGSGTNATLNGGAGIDWMKSGVGGNLVLVNNRLTGPSTNLVLSSIERADVSGDGILDATGFAGGALLRGNSGNDTLLGGAGNDTLLGGAGDDSLVGGAGVDRGGAEANADMTATGTVAQGQLNGEGTDRMVGVEIAQLTGGFSNNRLDASGFGGSADLNGVAGSDTLIGTALNDTLGSSSADLLLDSLVGGNGTDMLRAENLPGTFDLTNTALTRRSGNIKVVQLDSVESAYLTQGAGNSELNAAGFSLGPVTLIGGHSQDTLIGSTKSDFLDGRGGIDSVRVQGNFNYTLTDSLLQGRGQDGIANIEVVEITAGPGANRLDASGFSGMSFLFGLDGNDTLIGGSGRDTLNGGNGDDSLEGGAGDDALSGDGGNDTVNGGDGNDVLIDVNGIDVYRGGNGDDTLTQYSFGESTQFDGEAGRDTVVYPYAISGSNHGVVTVTDSAVTMGTGSVNLANVEVVKFNEIYQGRMDGSAATLSIFANASGGNETLIGGSGNDTLNGLGGNDSLIGGAGDDKLTGGDGFDTADSGLGNDTVSGHEVGE